MHPYRAEIRFARRYREVIQRLHAAEETSLRNVLRQLRSLHRSTTIAYRLGRRISSGASSSTVERNEFSQLVRTLSPTAAAISNVPLTPTPPIPELREVFADLQQLEEEFGASSIDLRSRTLEVTTEPITLQDTPLGRFTIRFELGLVNGRSGNDGFRIIALDPNPAAEESSVTHPHVRDEHLCAGESGKTIHQAVLEGRLTDAFLLIRGVLTNYNANSPHIPLDDWNGVRCGECAITIDPDDENTCNGCQVDHCGECVYECPVCTNYRCDACMLRCGGCDDRHCRDCLVTLETADGLYCPPCIQACEACGSRYPRSDFEAGESQCTACAEAAAELDARHRPAPPSLIPQPLQQPEAVHGMVTFVARI